MFLHFEAHQSRTFEAQASGNFEAQAPVDFEAQPPGDVEALASKIVRPRHQKRVKSTNFEISIFRSAVLKAEIRRF